ncbi:MAG TPA: oligopeptide transporter, OPT family [Gemmataceae bacterium]|jgi:putative OPT family oligopeptide transporter|nr:oligopeptide transporter, OPT family [Gemmataceae bacterium]
MAAPTEVVSTSGNKGGSQFQPYVPASQHIPELTVSAVLVGAVLGIIFGASSLYLMLKVGMTVSASIPIAVLSITLFRVFSGLGIVRKATILENNIVQTTGSAGESIAFGVGATMPALLLLGFEMEIGRVLVVSVLGGILGILMMIPLRRAFIVEKHGELKYPEGTACAEVLIVGEKGGSSAKTVFIGFACAAIYQILWQGLNLWKEVVRKPLSWFKGTSPALEVNPALLGVGYIIGPRIASIMVAGGVLATFVLSPSIRLFGDNLVEPLYPGIKPIKQMTDEEIGRIYIRYIGAGAVAAGGIISVFKSLPLILSSMQAGLRDLLRILGTGGSEASRPPRTDRDLPLLVVGLGCLLLVGLILSTRLLHQVFTWVPDLHMNPLGAILIVIFGFLFVTVSSRLTGEIGSSSNPISGMTVATLLLTCLIFLALGWTKPEDRLTALSVAGVVCVAASNGGTTSQDLKTGFLVGATPIWQQIAITVGALSSALVIGWILVGLNEASTVYTAKNLPPLKQPLDVASLTQMARAPGDDTLFHVWQAPEENPQGVPRGKYLVDNEGHLRYLVDPGINGKISRRDDGSEVRKYNAPQANLMALVTDGILTQKLPWGLVLLGVSIAVVMELCGVGSLAFAVGVYLPLSTTSPVFAGGLVRYVANRWARSTPGHQQSEAESDTSPGVLLSTGYIAGGTLAGVLIAFLNFSEEIPKKLNIWQYSTYQVGQEQPADEAYQEAAANDLGLAGKELNSEQKKDVSELAKEIEGLNEGLVPQFATVKEGTVLKLPGNKEHTAEQTATLGTYAEKLLGSADKATLLFDLNEKQLEAAKTLPAGTKLKLPQHNAPALLLFALLMGFLTLVGLGWLLKPPPSEGGTVPASPEPAYDMES